MKRGILWVMNRWLRIAGVAACAATPIACLAAGNTDASQIINLVPVAKPAAGNVVVDPAFSTIVQRVTGATDTGGFATHEYSQLQAFSSDDKYILLDGNNGFYVIRRADLSTVPGLDTSSWNCPRWHPTDPHKIVHFDGNDDTTLRLQMTSVDTLTTSNLLVFPPNYQYVRVNQSFDELSEDGRWLAGMATLDNGQRMIFAVDLVNRTIPIQIKLEDLYGGPCAPDPTYGIIEPDWIGISPLGRWLVIQWPRDGTARCSGLETFDLQSGAFTGRPYDRHQHGDLGIMPDGTNEFFMTFELYHPSGRLAIGLRPLPGSLPVSSPTYIQVLDWIDEHISCRGPPGVGLITTSADPSDGWSPLEGELFLQYTDGSVLRLAHHRSSSCGYWVQPRASISRDGRFVIFASDWWQNSGPTGCSVGDPLGSGEAYLIDLVGISTNIVLHPPFSTNRTARLDFDGDGKSDLAVFWPQQGSWFIRNSSDDSLRQQLWGWDAVTPLAADFDGDRKSDVTVFDPAAGTWYIDRSSDHALQQLRWGWNATQPEPADYDGDGRADIAVYHATSGNWYIQQSSTASLRQEQWGWSEALAVPADYDGDGRADVAVYHPASGNWYIRQSGNGAMRSLQWGWTETLPVPADYDGDGLADVAVYHPASGTWYILQSGSGSLRTVQWGWSEAAPVPADYDGDGQTDIAVYHQASGNWYILGSAANSLQLLNWGWSAASAVH